MGFSGSDLSFDIIYEDATLLTVNKPAAMATMGGRVGTRNLLASVRDYLGTDGVDPFIGILGRLDYPVSGLLVIAKNSTAAKHLVKQRDNRVMTKRYHALISGRIPRRTELLTDALSKSKRTRTVCKLLLSSKSCPYTSP